MKDALAHTRTLFSRDRVICGPERAYAMSRFNLAMGQMRDSIEVAEADADRFHATNERLPAHQIGWGACQ